MDFYIKMDEVLTLDGKLEPLEVLLYSRCYRFAENCKAQGREFYLDQTDAARFLRVSRKTLRNYVKRLEEVGLFVRIGFTNAKQVVYSVKDWESMKDAVLLPPAELEALNGKYQAERERNREQLDAHIEKKAAEANEPVSTSFKQNTPQSEPEAPQEPLEPVLIQFLHSVRKRLRASHRSLQSVYLASKGKYSLSFMQIVKIGIKLKSYHRSLKIMEVLNIKSI
ncbi:TPA: hypothetical protein ACV5RJ_002663 [Enterobacter roggenkampii]